VERVKPFLEGVYSNNPGDKTDNRNYFLGTGESSVGTQSGAAVSVTPPRTDYNFPLYKYSRDAEWSGGNTHFADRDEADNLPSGTSWAEGKAESNGQIPLFTAKHNPPTMDYLVSTKDLHGKAMDLAAHAAEETRLNYGERPWASSSLSKHSKPMVNSAIKAGLIKGISGEAEGEIDESSSDNGYNWAQGHAGVQDAADRIRGRVDSEGNPQSSQVLKVDPTLVSAHKGTIKAEIAHNRSADKLGIPRTASPREVGIVKGTQFNKDNPQLDFGF
jgi:hypothetical protein